MSGRYSQAVEVARDYYNSDDADNFYFQIWGGEDIHIGLYESAEEPIAAASQRTIETMATMLGPLDAGAHVTDLGAGYGGSARWLTRHFGCRVSCVNLSEIQNERNRSFNREAGLAERIDVHDASFEDLPLPDASCDVAWSQDSILHAGNRSRVFDEVDRVLVPGGSFIFTDPMQADDCPAGALKPVLDRLHLDSLGSIGFYREQARRLGWSTVEIRDLTPQLVNHYTRVREELMNRRQALAGAVSDAYIDRMIKGLGSPSRGARWIEAGGEGLLAWGILQFRKTA